MLDPKKLQSIMETSSGLGDKSRASLEKPFLDGMKNMEMSGSDSAKDIMNSVNATCKKMLGEASSLFNGIQDNVEAHQKMQQEEKPKDFETAMNDLRLKLSTGFPGEMKELFDKMPKIK